MQSALQHIRTTSHCADSRAVAEKALADAALSERAPSRENVSNALDGIEDALWALNNYESSRDDAGRNYSELDICNMASTLRAIKNAAALPQAGRTEAPNGHTAGSCRKDPVPDTEPAAAAPSAATPNGTQP